MFSEDIWICVLITFNIFGAISVISPQIFALFSLLKVRLHILGAATMLSLVSLLFVSLFGYILLTYFLIFSFLGCDRYIDKLPKTVFIALLTVFYVFNIYFIPFSI